MASSSERKSFFSNLLFLAFFNIFKVSATDLCFDELAYLLDFNLKVEFFQKSNFNCIGYLLV